MLKVLLVDDEPIARQYLRQLIEWEQHGFTIVGEAGGGREAIAIIEREEPHIVIADISMAGMDGVELSRYMSANAAERTKLIMLSSYDNYEFVRETMKNGAVDYLLKHRLDAEGLLDILRKVKREFDAMEERPPQLTYIERNWSSLSLEVARTSLKDWLLGPDENLHRAEQYFRHLSPIGVRNVIVTVIHVSEKHSEPGHTSASAKNKRMRAILDMIQQGLHQADHGIAAELDYGQFGVLTSYPEGGSERDIFQRLHGCLQAIAKSLDMYLNLRAVFASGAVCHKPEQIRPSYAAALRALANELPAALSGAGSGDIYTLSLQQEKELVKAVERLDRLQVELLLDRIFASAGDRKERASSLFHLINELIHLADKVWRKSGREGACYEGEYPMRHEMADPDKVDDLNRWTKRLYGQLIDKLSPGPDHRAYSSHVSLAMSYVNHHYAENISLDSAAEQAGITASYLGRLFKQETGVYFTDYLNQVRIEHAKKLIRSGRYKVNQINERVGFANYSYFFKVFKELVGMTPHNYAKSEAEQA